MFDDKLAKHFNCHPFPPRDALEKWVNEKLTDVPDEYKPLIVDTLMRLTIENRVAIWQQDRVQERVSRNAKRIREAKQ